MHHAIHRVTGANTCLVHYAALCDRTTMSVGGASERLT